MSKQLICSYINNRYVSTVYRASSACVSPPPWYYETLVWEWNPETRELGRILAMEGEPRHIAGALLQHIEECRKILLAPGEFDEDAIREDYEKRLRGMVTP